MASYSAKVRASPAFKAKVKAASSAKPAGGYSAAVRASPAFRAKVAANVKPASALTATQKAARAWILKTQTPVTPGSSLTQAQLASEAKAAAAEKYAPAEQQGRADLKSAQQFATNTQNWYKQYQQAAADNARQVDAANAQANTAVQNLGQAVGGLGGTDAQAQQAGTVRQALLGSIGALIAGQGANASRFAATQQNVVAPGQGQQANLAAQGGVNKALEDLKTLALQRGSFLGTYKGQRITDEQRNALAAATLTNTSNKTQAQITGVDPVTGKPTLAAKTAAQKAADAKAKVKQTAADKAAARKQNAQNWARKTHPGTDVSNGVWQLWGTQGAAGAKKRADALAAHQKLTHPAKSPKTPKNKSGYLTTPAQIKIVTRINDARHAFAGLNPGLTRAEVQTLVNAGRVPGVARLNNDEFNAAFNLERFKGLTENNVKALHGLGVQIKGRWKILPAAPRAQGNTNLGPGTSSTGATGNV